MAVLKADPEYRRKAVFVYLSMVTSGVALIAVVIHWGIPALEGYLESHLKEQRFEEALRIGQALLAALFLPLLPPAFCVYRFSRRILASGQCPPPGTKVMRDTE